MTDAQSRDAQFQAELAAYQDFLAANASGGTDAGPSFTFTTLGLTLSNFETVEVKIDDTINTAPVAVDDTGGLVEDDPTDTVTGNVLDNDSDADVLDTLSVSSVGATPPMSAARFSAPTVRSS